VKSRVVAGGGLTWPATPPQLYKVGGEAFCEVNRRVLLGPAVGDALAFEVRYFEVAPGGWTSFEHHEHPHAVLVLAGRGEVRLPDGSQPIAPFDVVYVAPGEPHQFRADAAERLGILCIVDAERDRPVTIED
jgi:quercetin dioxygenase-like cupin family protein